MQQHITNNAVAVKKLILKIMSAILAMYAAIIQAVVHPIH